METLQQPGKPLSKEEQKSITGGDDNCINMHGANGPCRTSAMCPANMPICEAN